MMQTRMFIILVQQLCLWRHKWASIWSINHMHCQTKGIKQTEMYINRLDLFGCLSMFPGLPITIITIACIQFTVYVHAYTPQYTYVIGCALYISSLYRRETVNSHQFFCWLKEGKFIGECFNSIEIAAIWSHCWGLLYKGAFLLHDKVHTH